MSIEVKPYTMLSKTTVIISAIASAVGLILVIQSPIILVLLLVCWFIPLMAFITRESHSKRSMIIADNEIICNYSARVSDSQLVYGGYLDSLTIKRKEIADIDTYFHANFLNSFASAKNLMITTNNNITYIIDGRILDIKAVKLALEGKLSEAEERIKKQSFRNRTMCAVANGFLCVWIPAMCYGLSSVI